MNQYKILIVGCGITGAALHHVLSKQGNIPKIIEKVETWSVEGAGICLPGNAMIELKKLGFDQKVMEVAHQVFDIEYALKDGETLTKASLKETPLDQAPFVSLARNKLLEILRDGLSDQVQFNTTIDSMQNSTEGVDVLFSNGDKEHFDLVVGTDGINSQVRSLAFTNTTISKSGITNWRFTASMDTTGRHPVYYVGHDNAFMIYPMGKNTVYCYGQVMDNDGHWYKENAVSALQSLFQYYIENFLDDEDFEFTTVPEYYDYQGKYEYRISATETLSFQAIGSRDKAGLLFAEDSDAVLQDPGLSGGLAFEAFFNSQGLVWEKLYTSGMTHKIGLSQMEQKLGFRVGPDNKIDVKVNDYNLRSQFSYPLNYQHELRWGVELTESQISYKGRFEAPPCDEFTPDCRIVDGTEVLEGDGKPTIYHYDAHLADAWDVTQNWTLTPGVALSYDDYTEQYFGEPRLQSRWQFTNNWWFTSAYGRHHILPDNFGDYVAPFGNPDLKQPTATHYELGIENQLANDMLWKFEVYYKDLDNIIIGRPGQAYYSSLTDDEYNDLPLYTNDADGKAWGMEFFLNKNLTERWYGWLSVAYSRTFRTNNLTGDDFSYNYDQPVIINSVANYKLNKDWQIGFKWRYQSGQLITPLEGSVQDADDPALYNPIYGNLNSERLPAYHKLDVRADRTYRFSG